MGFNKKRWQASNFDEKIGTADSYRRMGDSQSIHQEPNITARSPDLTYAGHIIFKETPNFISNITLAYTDTDVLKNASSAVTNVNLTSYLPAEFIDIKGVLIFVLLKVSADGGKTKPTTLLTTNVRYSSKYNITPGTFNIFGYLRIRGQAADADNYGMFHSIGHPTMLPVTKDSGIFYITWTSLMDFSSMVNANDSYSISNSIYLQGFIV